MVALLRSNLMNSMKEPLYLVAVVYEDFFTGNGLVHGMITAKSKEDAERIIIERVHLGGRSVVHHSVVEAGDPNLVGNSVEVDELGNIHVVFKEDTPDGS
jgi:hypothetical protein